ncbi:MAG: carboxypeptidase-like regulatory domain-containing protein [Verrucomicrobiota bacterium]|nr:carboxypeptidase-like regulatory domain-containing protein [Verrucomicrobiota bacterium]
MNLRAACCHAAGLLGFLMIAMTASATNSGFEGLLLRSPSQPGPTRQGVPDSAPMSAATLIVERDGKTVAEIKTDISGKFQLTVPPGHYQVSVKGWKRGMGSCGPFMVDVAAGKMKQVHWECDSGLR